MRHEAPFSRNTPRRPPMPLRQLARVLLVAAGAGLALVILVVGLARLGPTILLAFAGVALVAKHGLRTHHLRLGPPEPARASAAVPGWSAARARFGRLASDYAAYECDPLAVLRLPALADVRVPSTGRFVEAFAEAQALETDHEPGAAHRGRFVDAVDRAARAWTAARDAAERIALSGIPEQERSAVQRTIKLLTVARDSSNDAERLTAYAKARTELARLERTGTIRLPRPAQAALDESARPGLPGTT